jgi:hypothetical protein
MLALLLLLPRLTPRVHLPTPVSGRLVHLLSVLTVLLFSAQIALTVIGYTGHATLRALLSGVPLPDGFLRDSELLLGLSEEYRKQGYGGCPVCCHPCML